MKRTLKVSALIASLSLSAVALTGCGDRDDYNDSRVEKNIELGIKCKEAGGQWLWDDWTGYSCEFK